MTSSSRLSSEILSRCHAMKGVMLTSSMVRCLNEEGMSAHIEINRALNPDHESALREDTIEVCGKPHEYWQFFTLRYEEAEGIASHPLTLLPEFPMR